MRDDKAVYKLIHQLRTDGLAFITNVPGVEKSVAEIATRIGPVKDTFYGHTWDVRTVPEAINAAYTSNDLGFHTDLLYFYDPPHVQLLHCVQSASSGGASVFADAYKAAVDLFHTDPEAFERLATVPVNYHYNHPDSNVYRTTKPVIDLRPLRLGDRPYASVQAYVKDWNKLNIQNGGSGWSDAVLVDHMQKINWGPPFLAPFSNHQDPMLKDGPSQPPLMELNDKVDKWHEAAFKFNALLQRSEYLYERKMNSGDCVLFDNTRTLHSRRAFEAADVGKPRWLRGTYVDKDSYFSQLRVLKNRFAAGPTRADHSDTQLRAINLQQVSVTSQHDVIALENGFDQAWPIEYLPLSHVMLSHNPISTVDQLLWGHSEDLETFELSSVRLDPVTVPDYRIIQSPVHIPTTLVEYWFRHICPVRSTFDSKVNNNRSLVEGTWTTSEALFYTMQAMSAMCLMGDKPEIGDTLPLLREQAIFAIDKGISRIRTMQTARIPSDLVFAVFALGTSSHWTTPTPSGRPWLESAREILSMWRLRLSAAEALLYNYFCQAFTYWEMLVTVVGYGSNFMAVEKRRQMYRGRLFSTMGLEPDNSRVIRDENNFPSLSIKIVGTLPNSWCGISDEVIEVFGQVLALCRSACDYSQSNTSITTEAATRTLCDIAVANDLKTELLNMDFDTIVLLEEVEGYYVETQDEKTPVSHLLQTAEAYRKAGLLQLYLGFDDLIVSTDEGRAGSAAAGPRLGDAVDKDSRGGFLVDLALQLVAILETIPARSGSKFIHPMLYLSAAVGLRFGSHGPDLSGGFKDGSFTMPQVDWNPENQTIDTAAYFNGLATFIPQSILKVAEARRFVWARLSIFRQALPHKAGDSALYVPSTFYTKKEIATRISIVFTAKICGTVFAGIIVISVFQMSGNTGWLTEEARKLAHDRIAADTVQMRTDTTTLAGLINACKDSHLRVLVFMQYFHMAASNFKNFFPIIVGTPGFGRNTTLALTCPPYIVSGIVCIAWAANSGRMNERT
ncbi:unnamed protein product [Fusarium langsethiae]|nr:unnamed protein product [Fusarium langsethiae]